MTISNMIAQEYDMATIQGVLGYFGKLAELPGAYNRLQEELQETNKRLAEISEQVKILAGQVNDKTRELTETKDELRRTSDWLRASRESNNELRNTVRQRDDLIAAQKGVVEGMESHVCDLSEQVKGRDKTIAEKEAYIAEVEAENARLTKRLDRMIAIARGMEEVPTVDQVVAEQAKEVPADPLPNVAAAAHSPSTEADSSSERTTQQQPIAGPEYGERKEGWPSDQGFRPFAHATTTGHSGDPQSSRPTPDARPDGQLDPDIGRRDVLFPSPSF